MRTLMRTTREFLRQDSGATMVEYAIMVALIAAVAILIIKSVGEKTNNGFSTVNSAFQ